MPELRRLGRVSRAARDVAEKLGLTQRAFLVIPDESDDQPVNRVRIVYTLDPEFGMADELAELERHLRQPSHDPEALQRQRDATKDEAAALAQRLIDPTKGIL